MPGLAYCVFTLANKGKEGFKKKSKGRCTSFHKYKVIALLENSRRKI
jgi:hypothetical protein